MRKQMEWAEPLWKNKDKVSLHDILAAKRKDLEKTSPDCENIGIALKPTLIIRIKWRLSRIWHKLFKS